MTQQELSLHFENNHQQIIHFMDALSEQEFMFVNNGKWSAGQQLHHVYLTLLPFPKALSSKTFILEKFGKISRSTWDYNTVIKNYLNTNLQAPERFLPETVDFLQKENIINDIHETLAIIQNLLVSFDEEELDTLVLPHPLLGNLTIREMFYLMTYHPTHHYQQAKLNLQNFYSTMD